MRPFVSFGQIAQTRLHVCCDKQCSTLVDNALSHKCVQASVAMCYTLGLGVLGFMLGLPILSPFATSSLCSGEVPARWVPIPYVFRKGSRCEVKPLCL